MHRNLDQAQFVTALDGWVGATLALRVVAEGDELLAVAQGELGARQDDKPPSLFWPLGDSHPGAERPGIYLHPELFEGARLREGEFVLELRQAGVTLNLRRLES
jgi:hypothetical protein